MKKELERYNELMNAKSSRIDASEDDFISFLVQNSESEAPAIDSSESWKNLKNRIESKDSDGKMWLKIAASIALILGFGLYFLFNNSNPAFQTIASGDNKIKIELPDGSTVHLNANSEINYPTEFSSVREIRFSGEGFFEIEKDEKPFIVSAQETKIKVLGTAFNVNTGQNQVSVFVDHGLVAFQAGKHSIRLPKGTYASFENKEINVIENGSVNTDSWRDGKLEFDNTPLSTVILDLEKHYDVNFNLKNEKIGRCRVTAKFENDSLTKVLSTLELILDVKTSKKNNWIKISGKGC